MTNAANPTEVKSRARKQQEAREQELLDLQGLLKLPEFRRYLFRHIAGQGGIFDTPFNPSGSPMYFNVGWQDFARKLLKEVKEADPKAFPLMMAESEAGSVRTE